MADLIIKVVKASNNGNYPEYSGSRSRSTRQKKKSSGQSRKSKMPSAMFMGGNTTVIEAGVEDIEMADMTEGGIQKTTRTEVSVKHTRRSETDDRDMISDAESTKQLHREHFTV